LQRERLILERKKNNKKVQKKKKPQRENENSRVQVLRSTGLCSTIEIEEKLFDYYRKLRCPTQIMFDLKQQLSNIKLIEVKKIKYYVQLTLISME
jgi:hypothetical protein